MAVFYIKMSKKFAGLNAFFDIIEQSDLKALSMVVFYIKMSKKTFAGLNAFFDIIEMIKYISKKGCS
ncbi:hypothetical protein IMAU30049_00903 [Lactobacillus helveticus]|nr:hypothetical protein [Lactobacillus helveticus]NRO68308.1 hypothetical protein [Lactobacillus helveticus]PXZ18759.1 hypothetical protein DM474_09245 [Lactobacillus helveticus]